MGGRSTPAADSGVMGPTAPPLAWTTPRFLFLGRPLVTTTSSSVAAAVAASVAAAMAGL